MPSAGFARDFSVAVRIIHLTDCHLFADPMAEIRGVRVRDTFERVLAAVNRHISDADRLIVTGDLTHDEQLETYQLLKDRLGHWSSKLRVVPGNHDNRSLMRAVFGERIEPLGERNVFVEDTHGWRLIGLDSHVPGKPFGALGAEQLAWLERELRQASPSPICLFLHHPPVSVGSIWLDQIGLKDAESFCELVRRFPHVWAVCCGHIHQEFEDAIGDAAVFATPSTGVQFRPGTETLEVDSQAPGFRILELHPDGRFQTWVERVAALP